MEEERQPFRGQVLLTWTIDEYEKYQRGLLWYLMSGIIGGGILIYALFTQNFLFAVIVIMFGIIIGLSSLREPRQMDFVVTEIGVGVGHQFFSFKELKNFWMIYEDDVKNLYFEFKRSLRPHLVIPLYDVDPLPVRELLLDFLDEELDDQEESLSDYFGRILKL